MNKIIITIAGLVVGVALTGCESPSSGTVIDYHEKAQVRYVGNECQKALGVYLCDPKKGEDVTMCAILVRDSKGTESWVVIECADKDKYPKGSTYTS